MKNSLLFFTSLLAHRGRCGPKPQLQWDPATAKDCVDWYDNAGEHSCEYVRDYFSITPEQFFEWNPSVGLDCGRWEVQSYCIVTQRRLETEPPKHTLITATSTSKHIPSTTSSTSTALRPSPTSWKARGCYDDNNSELPTLEYRVSPDGGDTDLTISKCEDSCYRRGFEYAGVREGNQCWCSSFVGGESTKNQADCNIPCSGDSNTICGGKQLLNVFEALENDVSLTGSTTNGPTQTATSQASQSQTSPNQSLASQTMDSGARRNLGLLLF
ncbi:unnamed protein product [Clonostachys byssicola]|uniref:WSC domain-containing protein n=1 Tax=Clonostachys byssicola TaxID=160290 RepID=A0A9N9Y5D7_9HYPO|nr:unnamed protein product [Clonostachys byssicola]